QSDGRLEADELRVGDRGGNRHRRNREAGHQIGAEPLAPVAQEPPKTRCEAVDRGQAVQANLRGVRHRLYRGPVVARAGSLWRDSSRRQSEISIRGVPAALPICIIRVRRPATRPTGDQTIVQEELEWAAGATEPRMRTRSASWSSAGRERSAPRI